MLNLNENNNRKKIFEKIRHKQLCNVHRETSVGAVCGFSINTHSGKFTMEHGTNGEKLKFECIYR